MKPIEKSQIEQALNRDRPETDIERDENRMPAELLHFIEISEGQKVGEMNSGRGYLSAIIAYALEDSGTVYSHTCLLYTSPSPRDATLSRMPSSA